MRVFVTGATGWIGSAVVEDLLSSGHEVTGLTTTRDGANKLQALGVKARVGKLHDHALLREGAAESGDGVGIAHGAGRLVGALGVLIDEDDQRGRVRGRFPDPTS